MKPITQTVRAVAAEFLRRIARQFVIAGAAVIVLLLALAAWLVLQSVWWWLLLAPLIMLAAVFTGIVTAAYILLRVIDSAQNRQQRQAVQSYVDTLERVSDNLQTPQYIILYRVVRDILRPRQDGFVTMVSRDTQSLALEFKRLTGLFAEQPKGKT